MLNGSEKNSLYKEPQKSEQHAINNNIYRA